MLNSSIILKEESFKKQFLLQKIYHNIWSKKEEWLDRAQALILPDKPLFEFFKPDSHCSIFSHYRKLDNIKTFWYYHTRDGGQFINCVIAIGSHCTIVVIHTLRHQFNCALGTRLKWNPMILPQLSKPIAFCQLSKPCQQPVFRQLEYLNR